MYVAQEDEMGCAIACVANLLNISYQDAKQLFNPKFAKHRGYYCKSIVNALKKAGVQSHYKKYSDSEEINFGDIIFVGRCVDLPYGHWLLRLKEGWVDPWINLQVEKDINKAKAGIRDSLIGVPEWLVRPT